MSHDLMGYRRPDESVGFRNHLLVLSVTGLTGPAARRIAVLIPNTVVVDFLHDSGLLGEDRMAQERALTGLGTNANVGAVIVIGANPPKVDAISHEIAKSGKPVQALSLDDCGHDALTLTDRGIRLGGALVREISRQRREPADLSNLFLGLECGRSDSSSGLVSNPLMGLIADRVVDEGGKAVIGESTEWLGAEHLLARRAATPDVAAAISDAVLAREQAAVDAGHDLTGNNPGPTNIAAGLSTVEEKSLGSIAKSGSRPIQSLLKWAEAPASPGLHAMDAPAYAPESLTGFAAAGTQLVIFSTGVGNSYVNSIAPTIKISANPVACEELSEQIDYACASVITGENTLEHAADELLEHIVEVASGTRTWGEIFGESGEAFSRFGASL